MIIVANKKRKIESIQKEYPNAYILDLTSTSTAYAQKLSPFYPHMNIPVPFSPGYFATCVEAVWQGLKVFAGQDVDFDTFKNATMKNLKRTVRKFGMPLGHRKGVHGKELLGYYDARMLIYVPTYLYVLEHVPSVQTIVTKIKEQAAKSDIVFLDYNTNCDVRDISTPLSHAGLVKLYIEGNYPVYDPNIGPYSPTEIHALKEGAKVIKKRSSSGKPKRKSAKQAKKEMKVGKAPSLFDTDTQTEP